MRFAGRLVLKTPKSFLGEHALCEFEQQRGDLNKVEADWLEVHLVRPFPLQKRLQGAVVVTFGTSVWPAVRASRGSRL